MAGNNEDDWLSGLDSNPRNQVPLIVFRNPACQQLHRYLQSQMESNSGMCHPNVSPSHNSRFAVVVMCLITNEAAYRNVHYDSLAFNVLAWVWHDVKVEFHRQGWHWANEKWQSEKGKLNSLFMGARCENYITNNKFCTTTDAVYHPPFYLAADFSRIYDYSVQLNASLFTLFTCIRLCWREEAPPDYRGAATSGYSRFLRKINSS